MSKALVIKGASFATNKVRTITISNPVPCTGIALNKNSIAFTAIGATDTLTATLTPVDTTEALTWASSDTDVATVSNGVVTSVGIGTATITAYCGEQSASCTVTSLMTVVLDTAYHAGDGYRYSGSITLPTKNHVGITEDAKGRLFYSTEDILGGYRAFVKTENAGKFAIPLPSGANTATIIPPAGLGKRHANFVLCDTTQKQTYITGADGQAALGIYAYTRNNNTDAEIVIDISEYAPNANGFIASFTGTDITDISEVTGTTTIIFS